jgi:hypothetical protein
VTTQGERISWGDSFDGSKTNTLECFEVAREFLGFSRTRADKSALLPQPPPVTG